MKMLKVSQCKKNFNFRPQSLWPRTLPAFAWKGELLCDFDADSEKDVLDLAGTTATDALCENKNGISLCEIVSDLYKNLSLAELARIHALQFLSAIEFAFLLEKNALRASESLTDLLQKLVMTPLLFQNWTSERKLGPKELFVLKAVEEMSQVETLLSKIAQENPSRQNGIQILENGVELILMGHTLEDILPSQKETCDEWTARLEKLRNPLRTSQMSDRQTELSALPWPKFITAKVIQNQASLVNEVRLQYRNIGELKRNIDALQKVHGELENSGQFK